MITVPVVAEQGKNSCLQNSSSDLFMFYHTTFHRAPSPRLFIPQWLNSFMYTPPSRNYLVYYMGKRHPEAHFNNEHHESLPMLNWSRFPVRCLSSVSKPDCWVSTRVWKALQRTFPLGISSPVSVAPTISNIKTHLLQFTSGPDPPEGE